MRSVEPAGIDQSAKAVRALSDSGGVDSEVSARLIAFYLPQFHPIPENNDWWGEGFTDWTKVRAARPLFAGHSQPAVPSTLGYYDLRDVEVHHAQADLARTYGLGGFCYYAYWFKGRRLLEKPLELVLRNPDLQLPYAICWANETWSRRWDGSEREVLLAQQHDPVTDATFIDAIAEHLADERYIRVRDRPLLLIYRPGLLADPVRTTDLMRERAVQLGVGEPYLAMVQSFGHWEPISYGFDAAVEFPPHNLGMDAIAAFPPTDVQAGTSRVLAASYVDAMRVCLSRPVPLFPWHRGVMPAWDNTPRRGERGTVFVGADPSRFRIWVEAALESTYLFNPPGERLLFINAWNEWGEGAYLEPDETEETARLQAIVGALEARSALAADTAAAFREISSNSLLDVARARWRRVRSRQDVHHLA